MILHDRMNKRAAEIFANELYDELEKSGLLDDEDIICNQSDEPVLLTESPRRDHNFILWSLIPYIAACSGERVQDHGISFDDVATIRPDGGYNIVNASVVPEKMSLPDDYVYMKNWCGPMWNEKNGLILWQINSEWSDRGDFSAWQYPADAKRVLSLLENDELPKDDWVWLAEHGYVKTNGDYDGYFKASSQIVTLASNDIKMKLIEIGDRIKEKHKAEFDALKAPYAEASLGSVPKHLRKAQEYELQFIFHSDGWFLLHCIVALLKNGKLKEPTAGQRKSLMTIIAPK